jgi:hypothetical protein
VSHTRIVTCIDQLDAIELAETCEFLAQWLAVSPDAASSYDRHVGRPGSAQDLRDDLLRLKTLIETAPGTRR